MRKIKLLVILIISLFIVNLDVLAATEANTLAELRSELQALKNKKKQNDNQKNKTKNEIAAAKDSVYESRVAIDEGKVQIENSKKEIESLNQDILNSKEKIKILMNSYQKNQGENIFLEYLFEAESYADFVYRYSIIEQIAEFNDKQIDDMQNKITENEELQESLVKKEEELNQEIVKLENSIASLGNELDEMTEITMDIQDEIDSTAELVEFYEDMGCGENEDLDDCVAVKGDNSFRKPLTKGTITSYFGYRIHPIKKVEKFHSGIDIGGNSEGTSVYATANGMVGKIIRKASCGGNQVYIYHTIGGKQYTSAYLHLLKINVSVGDSVTSNTVIGTVGGGKGTKSYDTCSTGAHLHFTIASGWYGKTYTSYNTYLAKTLNPKEILNLPSKYTYWYKR